MKEIKDNNSSFATDALYNTVGNVVYLFCMWVVTVLVVRLSGYEDAGILSVAMTTANIFFVVANYGMRSFQASDVKNLYSNQQYVYSRFATVVLSVILCLLFSIVSGYAGEQFFAIQIYMLFKAVEAFADVLFGVMQRGHRLKSAGISLVVKGICSVAGFVVGLLLFRNLIWALMIMFIASMMIALLYDIPQTLKIDSTAMQYHADNNQTAAKLLKECFPMFLVSVAPMILQAIPKLSFERMYSTAELGIYSSVAAPTVVLSTLVSCIMIPFLPMFADAIQAHDRKKLFKLLMTFSVAVISLGAVACLAAWLLGGWALSLLYGNNLSEYAVLLVWVLCSVTLTSLLYCLNALFISGRKLSILAVVYLAADLLCWLISAPMIQIRGLYGITDALNITQLVQCIVLTIICIPLFFRKNP